MKDFLERNAMAVTGIAIAAAILAAILGILLYGARELQLETLQRYDKPVNGAAELPGLKDQISTRSKLQIQTLIKETPHVVGGWVTKINYEKLENPVIYYSSQHELFELAMKNYEKMQLSGRGYSSAELNALSEQSLRNSEEAKTGLIKCGPLSSTNLPMLAPGIDKIVKGVCRATIPPFDENVNLAIVVVIDEDGNSTGPAVQAVRRMLLQLQIDIFNRDYQGRETWARAGTVN